MDEAWHTVEQNGKSKPSEGSTEITILLLGETGVGKSTWINGFANFLAYDTLNEAEESPTLCLIPSSFTMTNENYEERLVAIGSDENECTLVGQSATQHPQSYIFPYEGNIIRLIDTPGIGDVRGLEQDKRNFEMILNHISHLDNLDAICILLKPNNARLDIMFSFCIKELLTHLHRDACRNIVFCFTNSRSTFYRPGETLPALRELLHENKEVTIPLNKDTLYCMDNESIRFLYALKDGINFTEEDRKSYNASWDKSVSEVNRLIKHAFINSPHSIQNTLSLNNARHTILALGSPLAEITRCIQLNIANGERQREELITSQLTKDELSKKLIIEKFDVKTKILKSPRTICTAPKCVELIKVDEDGRLEIKTNYKTHCHWNCTTGKKNHSKIANIVGHENLKKCSAFDRRGNCRNCGCSYKHHMKITYKTTVEKRECLDAAKQEEIGIRESAIREIEAFLVTLDKYLAELRQEQQEITKASATFAAFLKKNAIAPYNDALIAYLEHFIHEEENKVSQGGDPMLLRGMEEMRANYKEQIRILKEAMEKGANGIGDPALKISTEDLEKCVNNLYQLKHCGQNLRQMMKNSMWTEKLNYTEKRVERTRSFNSINLEMNGKKSSLLKDIIDFFRGSSGTQNLDASGEGKYRPLPLLQARQELSHANKQIPPQGVAKPKSQHDSLDGQSGLAEKQIWRWSFPMCMSLPSKQNEQAIPQNFAKQKLGVIGRQSAKAESGVPQNLCGGGPPPSPPLPAVDLISAAQLRGSKNRSALLEEIRNKKQLKKTNGGVNLTDENSYSTVKKEKKYQMSSPIANAMDALKKDLELRAQRTQDSDDDEYETFSDADFL